MSDIDLRCGDWREALSDVDMVDAVITDPPYGARTHDDSSLVEQMKSATGQETRNALGYSHFTPADVAEFIASWAPRCRGWMACFTSHDLIPAYTDAYEAAGLYAFAPVPWICKRPRLVGDGPSSWTCYLQVARPRNVLYSRWGCLPGAYLPGAKDMDAQVVGSKPLWLMRAIVRDYTRKGDTICDPCAGGGTTLMAARDEGRWGIGAELDPETHAKAAARCAKPSTLELFTGA